MNKKIPKSMFRIMKFLSKLRLSKLLYSKLIKKKRSNPNYFRKKLKSKHIAIRQIREMNSSQQKDKKRKIKIRTKKISAHILLTSKTSLALKTQKETSHRNHLDHSTIQSSLTHLLLFESTLRTRETLQKSGSLSYHCNYSGHISVISKMCGKKTRLRDQHIFLP